MSEYVSSRKNYKTIYSLPTIQNLTLEYNITDVPVTNFSIFIASSTNNFNASSINPEIHASNSSRTSSGHNIEFVVALLVFFHAFFLSLVIGIHFWKKHEMKKAKIQAEKKTGHIL
eukprot:NODE_175_length_15885_cov_0.420563.p13 type:complete len:116 gc:universal NODE_175_length_15885_cov_0.420563:9394-9047(-)